MNEKKTFCTFFLGELYFGIEVKHVREVLRSQRMTHVPFAPRGVGGLINLRGEIITSLDLREMIDIPDQGNQTAPMNLVVHSDGGPVSLLVDEIGDVIDVCESQFEPTGTAGIVDSDRYIQGAYKLKDRLMLSICIEEITQTAA